MERCLNVKANISSRAIHLYLSQFQCTVPGSHSRAAPAIHLVLLLLATVDHRLLLLKTKL